MVVVVVQGDLFAVAQKQKEDEVRECECQLGCRDRRDSARACATCHKKKREYKRNNLRAA